MNKLDRKIIKNRVGLWKEKIKNKDKVIEELESQTRFHQMKIEKIQKQIQELELDIYEIKKKLEVLKK